MVHHLYVDQRIHTRLGILPVWNKTHMNNVIGLRFSNYLMAVESDSFNSNVKLSPEDRKLSDSEHGRGNRVAFANIK